MKTKFKMFSMIMSLIMALSSSMSVFAAEASDKVTQIAMEESDGAIPIVTEDIVPMSQGDEITFPLGSQGTISNAGFYPTFEMWVTGGNSSIQVKFDVTSPGGVHLGPYGPVHADGSDGWYLSKTALVANGTWKFTAYISNGASNPGNLVCHIKQSK